MYALPFLLARVLFVLQARGITGAVILSCRMDDPEKSSALSEWIDTTDEFSADMEEIVVNPTATPSLGAIVGNQVYLVAPVGANTLAETGSQ